MQLEDMRAPALGHQKDRALAVLAGAAFMLGQVVLNPTATQQIIDAVAPILKAMDGTSAADFMAATFLGTQMIMPGVAIWLGFWALGLADHPDEDCRKQSEWRIQTGAALLVPAIGFAALAAFIRAAGPAIAEQFRF